ncbi:MAG TPA: 30S ribosomal protein S4, partial [Gemmatimonadales bacterium]|nr:30S ribosomal protein S4 [Gemmatimonadales bacterium]
VAQASRDNVYVKMALQAAGRQMLNWITVDADKVAGRVTERPTREAIPINAQEQLIVELYSK